MITFPLDSGDPDRLRIRVVPPLTEEEAWALEAQALDEAGCAPPTMIHYRLNRYPRRVRDQGTR